MAMEMASCGCASEARIGASLDVTGSEGCVGERGEDKHKLFEVRGLMMVTKLSGKSPVVAHLRRDHAGGTEHGRQLSCEK